MPANSEKNKNEDWKNEKCGNCRHYIVSPYSYTYYACGKAFKQIAFHYPACENFEKREGLCFITSAVCKFSGKPDDCIELTLFRKFRDDWLMNQHDGKYFIDEYYDIAPAIVEKIDLSKNPTEIYERINKDYIQPCVQLIAEDKNESCFELYKKMICDVQVYLSNNNYEETN